MVFLIGNGCNGRCSGTIQSAGFKIGCNTSTVPYNLLPPIIYSGQPYNISNITVRAFSTTFDFSKNRGDNSAVPIRFSSSFKPTGGCKGNLQQIDCDLFPAILQSQVIVMNNTIILDPAYTYKDDQVIQFIPVDPIGLGEGPDSTYGGLGLPYQSCLI